MSLGARIRGLREAKGLRQVDLAEKVGLKGQGLYRIEVGDVENPRLEVLASLARELGVTTDFLITGEAAAESEDSVRRPSCPERVEPAADAQRFERFERPGIHPAALRWAIALIALQLPLVWFVASALWGGW